MIQVYKNLIKALLLSVVSVILSSCNDLSVFVPLNTQSSLGVVQSISINEEGLLQFQKYLDEPTY